MNHTYTIYTGSVGIPSGNAGSLSGHGEGISTLVFDGESVINKGAVSSAYAGIVTLAPGPYLYASNEARDFGRLRASGGGVSAYRLDEDHQMPVLINDSLSYGSRPSYVTVSSSGKYILVTNHGSHSAVVCSYEKDENGEWKLKRGYDDSSIAVFRRNEDGSIGELCDLQIMKGSGYWCYDGGQSTSHLHCVRERNGLVFTMNRGGDEIEVFRLQEESGKLQLLQRYHTRPGYAPRHMDFHPEMNILYVVNENYPSMCVYAYDESGIVKELQFLPVLEDAYYEKHPLPSYTKRHASSDEVNTSGMGDRTQSMPSDIHITPDGRLLFVSVRNFLTEGNLSAFTVNPDGTLELSAVHALSSRDPRGFGIIDNQYLMIGCCDEDLVKIYETDEKGTLLQEVCQTSVQSPSSFAIRRNKQV